MASGGDALLNLVLVLRHGAKNQLRDEGVPISDGLLPLEAYSNRSFRHWFDSKPGELSSHGRINVQQMAAFLGTSYGIPCTSQFYADPVCNRDIETAQIFATALGCDAAIVNSREPPAGIFKDVPDLPLGRETVVARVGSLQTLPELYSAAIGVAEKVLGCCEIPACTPRHCSLSSLSNGVADTSIIDRPVLGALGVASYVAELVQMAHCSSSDTGVPESDMRLLLELVALQQSIGAGSASGLAVGLMSAIWDRLHTTPAQTTLLFGHDTNIQLLRALLQLEWRSEGWARNLAEPMSLLAFERYANGSFGIAKVAATPSQQKQGTRPTPLARQQLWLPGCAALTCTPGEFEAALRDKIHGGLGGDKFGLSSDAINFVIGAAFLCVVISLLLSVSKARAAFRRAWETTDRHRAA